MKRFLALTALLLALGLLASRTGLVLHEVGGHWGVAAAFGCQLREIHLFYFGGGWVDFDCAALTQAQSLAIQLGGIALQGVVAVPLLWMARRWPRSVAGLACLAAGSLFAVHGLFYLATGVHYGIGDGRELHQLLGARRWALVAVVSVVLVASCGVGAWSLARRLASRVAGTSWARRVAMLASAMLLAAAIHGALMAAELWLRGDRVYAASFQPESERRVERDVKRYEEERKPTPEEVEALRKKLAAQYRAFPLRAVLGVGMGVAALGGIAMGLRSLSAVGTGCAATIPDQAGIR